MISPPDINVTVGILIYKSAEWLNFALEGLHAAKNETRYNLMVVANDAPREIEELPTVTHIWRNSDPSDYYIRRVYRAWNFAVKQAATEYVVLMNSDMYASDYWLDELIAAYFINNNILPTSMLVESGQLLSKCPQWVRDFGRTPRNFNRSAWIAHADNIRQRGMIVAGDLYMPVFLKRSTFLELGGYPTDQKSPQEDPSVIPGDVVFFAKYASLGYFHVTALGSVVYHVQEGEMRA